VNFLSASTATGHAVTVSSVAGLLSASTLDKIASASGNSASPSSGSTAATTRPDEFLYGCVSTNGDVAETAGTWSNSFTNGQRNGTTGGSAGVDMTASEGYKQVSATGAYAAAKTGITSQQWQAAIATYKIGTDAAEPFTFIDQTDVASGTAISSNIVQIVGGSCAFPANISIAGSSAQYRICSDATCSTAPAYTSTAGTITNGQYVQLKLTSSASTCTALTTTLTIGTVSDVWSVKSRTAAPVRTGLGTGALWAQKAGVSPFTTPTFALANGDALLVCVSSLGVISGVTWNGTAMNLDAGGGGSSIYLYSLPNVTGATAGIVVSGAVTRTTGVVASKVTGLATTNMLDRQDGFLTGTGTAAYSLGTVPTTQALEFLYGCIAGNGPNTVTASWLNSFNAGQVNGTSGSGAASNATVYEGYQSVTATASYMVAATMSANNPWSAALATYKQASCP
jgi:hypothetical protein